MRPVRGILFDVYGTLVEIPHPQRPYRRLIDLAERQAGAIDRVQAARIVMCEAVDLGTAARRLGVELTGEQREELEQALQQELASICPYPETEQVLATLRARGLRVGVCSNLALPYIDPVLDRLGHLIDQSIWSCQVGVLKPDAEIFRMAVDVLGLEADSVAMVGDSYEADCLGARAAGLQALHLDRRHGRGDIASLLAVSELALAANCFRSS